MSKARHGPRPLRSMSCPDGLPGLKNLDLLRTALANVLYSFATVVILECEAYQVWWTIEKSKQFIVLANILLAASRE